MGIPIFRLIYVCPMCFRFQSAVEKTVTKTSEVVHMNSSLAGSLGSRWARNSWWYQGWYHRLWTWKKPIRQFSRWIWRLKIYVESITRVGPVSRWINSTGISPSHLKACKANISDLEMGADLLEFKLAIHSHAFYRQILRILNSSRKRTLPFNEYKL